MAPRPPRRKSAKDDTRKVKKRFCQFCKDKTEWVDYKDVATLRKFISDRAKIRARRVTGNCVQHQRDVAIAIRTARELALIPYTQRTVSERGPKRPREDRGPREDRDRSANDATTLSELEADLDAAGALDTTDLAIDEETEQ